MDVLPLHLLGTHAQSFVALEKVPCHLPDRSVHLPQLGDLGFLAANFGHKMIDWCLCLCHTLLGLHCTRLLGLHCTRHREQHVKQDAKTLDNLFGENPQRIQNFLSIRHDSLAHERQNEDRAALKSGILTRQKKCFMWLSWQTTQIGDINHKRTIVVLLEWEWTLKILETACVVERSMFAPRLFTALMDRRNGVALGTTSTNSLTTVNQRDLRLLEARQHLIVTKTKTDIAGLLTDHLSDASRQFSQDCRHMISSNPTMAGSGVYDRHASG